MSKLIRAIVLNVAMQVCVLGCVTSSYAFDLFGYSFDGNGITKTQDASANQSTDVINYQVRVTSVSPAIEAVISGASLLVTEQANLPEDTTSLLARARVDQKRILAALYGEARYGAVLKILINNVELEDIPFDSDYVGKTVDVRIDVDAGPEFLFGQLSATADGQAIDLSTFGIVANVAAKSGLILDAQTQIIADWRDKGYAFAVLNSRSIEADHGRSKLDVSLLFDKGMIAHVRNVRVEGAVDVRVATIVQVADMQAGSIYNPTQIKQATRQLQDLGVFNSAVIKVDDETSYGDQVDLIIEVSERKPRTLGVGVTAGNLDGLGIEGFWVHRNLFGGAERLRAEASVGRIGQGNLNSLDFHTALVYFKPDAFGPKTSFEGKISFDIENSSAFVKRGGKAEAGLTHQLREELTLKGGISAEYAVVTNEGTTTNTGVFSAPIELTYDTRDNALDPTAGIHATVFAEPTYVLGSNATFVKSSIKASTYYAFDKDKKFVLAGRVAAGSIFGAALSDVPVDRRFFAGGAGSVRGYGYQAAGPRSGSNVPTGGLSFAEMSVEARYRINEQFGVVGFVDSGGAFTSNVPGQGGSFYTGVGAGVRYITPLGPIRADFAIPINKITGQPEYGLYLGIGQAF